MAETDAYVVHSSSISNQSETESYTSHVQIIVLYKRRWVVLAIFSLISMSNELIWISFSSIASVIKGYYNVSYQQISWLAMLFNIFYFLVPLASYFMSKFGLKLTIITGAVLNAIGSYFRIAGRFRDGFTYILIGNGFAALAQCFLLFVPSTLAAVWFCDTERAKATSIGVLANIFGIALGFLMGGLLVPDTKDYDGIIKDRIYLTLLLQTILCSILVLVSIIFLQEAPLRPPSMSQYLKRKKRVNRLNPNSVLENHNARYTDHVISYNIAMEQQYSNFEEFQKAMQSITSEKRKQSTVLDLKLEQSQTKKFLSAARKLSRNVSFHLILQAFALFSAPFIAASVHVNHWCTLKFPGNEQNIGLMGFVAVICGLIGMPIAGVLVDKTHRYKTISLVLSSCSAAAILLFTFVLVYSGNFAAVFVTFCIQGLISYPFLPVALEYAADVTYPISEGISSSIMFALANGYGLITVYVMGFILKRKRADIAGYVLVAVYVAATLCLIFVRGTLKRLDADKRVDISSMDNDPNVWKTEVTTDDISGATDATIVNHSAGINDESSTKDSNCKVPNGLSVDRPTDIIEKTSEPCAETIADD